MIETSPIGRISLPKDQYGDKGFAGYRVAPSVRAHDAWGVGVYSFFRDHNVSVASGIVAPAALEVRYP